MPEASLLELCEYCEEQFDETISKSGMKHRLAKLKKLQISIAMYKRERKVQNRNGDEDETVHDRSNCTFSFFT